MSSAEERILYVLKSRGAQTTAAIAQRLEITSPGTRQHLDRLLGDALVQYEDRAEGVGRPRRYWSLTATGHGRFPDAHDALTAELIASVRDVFGEAGLEKLIEAREVQTLAQYKASLAGAGTLGARVRRLAAARDREGYMAEAQRVGKGEYLLVENHCPICVAAEACQGFCRSELEVFREALGRDSVAVTREDHLLAGARRCAYRIKEIS
ncbi:MAG: metalloregulator ArsR/SmtB family transcription factor [Pseudomonadota bacterium]